MPKSIVYDQEARQGLLRGVQKLSKAVKMTLGPKGRNVMIERGFGSPSVTKDGVTVAREVDLEDRWENMGAQLTKGAAEKSMNQAGDGTTTATLLAEAIVTEGLKNVTAGASPIEIRRGIEAATKAVIEYLKEKAIPVKDNEDIRRVATIAANGDTEIGNLVAKALAQAGTDGHVTLERGRGTETKVEHEQGLHIGKGFLSPHFVTSPSEMKTRLENPLILITTIPLRTSQQVVPALTLAHQERRNLLVIAPGIEGDALGTLILNRIRGVVTCCAVRGPGFGEESNEMLHDIAVLTGATVVDPAAGYKMEDLSVSMFGTTNEDGYSEIDKDHTVIVGANGSPEKIKERIQYILGHIEHAPSDFRKEQLQKRASKMAGGISKVIVGGHTEAEVGERFDRVDDSLRASLAAREIGLLPGGGSALVKASLMLKETIAKDSSLAIGMDIVRRALNSPIQQIAENAGLDGSVILMEVQRNENFNHGFDAANNKYGDMIEMGIVDPAKVTITALETAASVAIMILTTNVSIAEIPERDVFSMTGRGNPN